MLNNFVNRLWLLIIPLILIYSLIFSIRLGFLQIKNFSKFKNCFKKTLPSEISPFQAFSMSLAGKIGVGSISGIYMAIKIGGYGSIFWLWVSCILFSILSYAEGCLAQIYKQKKNNSYTSGPYHYIKKGLHSKIISWIYAFLIFITYCLIFTSIQVKTIAISFKSSFNIPHFYTGVLISFLIFLIVFYGTKGIAKTCEKLIPFMAISYLLIGLIIIFQNLNLVPLILKKIFEDAFNFKAISPSILITILIGVRRGIFSTEVGVGTSAILGGSVNSSNPTNQGYVQILTVYITALVVCSTTAFIILIADTKSGNLLNVENSLNYFLGNYGNFYLSFTLSLFGISTIISAYYFGISVFSFIFDKNIDSFIFKILITLVCIYSSTMDNSLVWNLADIFTGFLIIINSTSMFLLLDEVVEITKKYES